MASKCKKSASKRPSGGLRRPSGSGASGSGTGAAPRTVTSARGTRPSCGAAPVRGGPAVNCAEVSLPFSVPRMGKPEVVTVKNYVVTTGGKFGRRDTWGVYKYGPLTTTVTGGKWELVKAEDAPCARTGHAVAVVDDTMYLFGGWDSQSQYNDLYKLEWGAKRWEDLTDHENGPSHRSTHTAVHMGDGQVYVFGGACCVGGPYRYLEDLFRLDTTAPGTDKPLWEEVETSGSGPSARGQHIAFPWHNRYMFVLGGADHNFIYNDLFYLDVSTSTWTRVLMAGEGPPSSVYLAKPFHPPPARRILALDAVRGRVCVYGGPTSARKASKELWSIEGLDPESPDIPTWVPLASATRNAARAMSGAVVAADTMIILGGRDTKWIEAETMLTIDLSAVDVAVRDNFAGRPGSANIAMGSGVPPSPPPPSAAQAPSQSRMSAPPPPPPVARDGGPTRRVQRGGTSNRYGDGVTAPNVGQIFIIPEDAPFCPVPQFLLELPTERYPPPCVELLVSRALAFAEGNATPALSVDQLMALYVYTYEMKVLDGDGNEQEQSTPHQIYGEMNSAMRESSGHEQWHPLIRHLMHALQFLPATPTTVYRGVGLKFDMDTYSTGTRVVWPAFSSSSFDKAVAMKFIEDTRGSEGEMGTLFVVHGVQCKSIERYSHLPKEHELLFGPNSQFQVVSQTASGMAELIGCQLVEMKEAVDESTTRTISRGATTSAVSAVSEGSRSSSVDYTSSGQMGGSREAMLQALLEEYKSDAVEWLVVAGLGRYVEPMLALGADSRTMLARVTVEQLDAMSMLPLHKQVFLEHQSKM